MAQDVNGIVYLVGKEKAIINGFFGKTVNPDIVFLFVNKSGKKYYINYDILKSTNNQEIKVAEFYKINRIDYGRRFSFEKSNKKFDEKSINEVINDKELSENIEFNKKIIEKELKIQINMRKKKGIIFDISSLLVILTLYSLTVNFMYAIPFIISTFIMFIINILYNKKMLKVLEKLKV